MTGTTVSGSAPAALATALLDRHRELAWPSPEAALLGRELYQDLSAQARELEVGLQQDEGDSADLPPVPVVVHAHAVFQDAVVAMLAAFLTRPWQSAAAAALGWQICRRAIVYVLDRQRQLIPEPLPAAPAAGPAITVADAVVAPANPAVRRPAGQQQPHRSTSVGKALIAAKQLKRVVGQGKVLLHDVDFVVRQGEIVAVLSETGAGKSTLIKVLNRYVPPDGGILYVAQDSSGRQELGYLPQDDVIHRQLPLRDAVELSAMIRFPPGTPRWRVSARADEVLDDLGLRKYERTRVDKLSGGQRKRANLALELMTDPSLLILDEATSGLDPATVESLMLQLRRLADTGRVGIVLITHSMQRLEFADRVAVLAEGGYLVFWGTPAEVVAYFGVERPEEIFTNLQTLGTPAEWRSSFERSPYFRAFQREVAAGLQELGTSGALPTTVARPNLAMQAWQLRGLVHRYLRIVLADRVSLLFFLLQLPVFLLAAMRFPDIGARSAFALANRDVMPSMQLLFIMTLAALWVGASSATRELCKERAIWQRERHIGVTAMPYVMSKVIVLGGLAVVQALTLVAIFHAGWRAPEHGGTGLVGLLATGFVGILSGMALGLILSALSPTPDRAMSLLPAPLVFQVLLAGMIVPIAKLGAAGNVITAVAPARWLFGALGAATARERALGWCARQSADARAQSSICGLYDQVHASWYFSLGMLALLCAGLLVLTALLVAHEPRGWPWARR